MVLLLGSYLLAGFALHGELVSVEGGLWMGAVLCAVLVAQRRDPPGSFVTIGAGSMAVLLGSLALVTP